MISDAAIIAIATGVTTTVGLLITSVFSYLSLRQSKANAIKVDAAAVVATETNRKQDNLIEKAEQIHVSTDGNLTALKVEVAAYKEELRNVRATMARLAEQRQQAAPIIVTPMAAPAAPALANADQAPVPVVITGPNPVPIINVEKPTSPDAPDTGPLAKPTEGEKHER